MATATPYAASAYVANLTQALAPVDVMLQLYDFAVAGCLARDMRRASAAIVELIAGLNFEYEEMATGFYRLYEYSLREVKAGRFEEAHRILGGLRDTWRQALGRPVEAAVEG